MQALPWRSFRCVCSWKVERRTEMHHAQQTLRAAPNERKFQKNNILIKSNMRLAHQVTNKTLSFGKTFRAEAQLGTLRIHIM